MASAEPSPTRAENLPNPMKTAPAEAPPYAVDFALPDFGEAQRETPSSRLSWDEIVDLFEEQRLAYMRDHDTPEERLANKVPERFVM